MSAPIELTTCFTSIQFNLEKQSIPGGGDNQTFIYGDQYWKISLTAPEKNTLQTRELEAAFDRMEGGSVLANIYDPRRPKPWAYRNVQIPLGRAHYPWGDVKVKSVDRSASTIELHNMREGATLTIGDYIGFNDTTGRRWLHRAVETKTADASGEMIIEVRKRPGRNLTGLDSTTLVDLFKVHGLFIVRQHSIRTGQGLYSELSYEAAEYIGSV